MGTEAPFSKLNVFDDLVMLADIIGSLKASQILVLGTDSHYKLVNPSTGAIATEAAEVESILTAHGVTLPAQAQKLVTLLPTILSFLN